MSAILLLDEMPKHCLDCPLNTIVYECVLQEDSDTMNWEEQKANCPLKALPEEKKRSFKKGYKSGYADGWDDCLDEIVDGKVESEE